MEVHEVSNFINEIRQENVNYFTYQDYENWAYVNNRAPVQQSRFNAIILTKYGFAWNIETGFTLR